MIMEKVKAIQGCEFKGRYWICATTESGALLQNSFDLKDGKWGDWQQINVPTPVPNQP